MSTRRRVIWAGLLLLVAAAAVWWRQWFGSHKTIVERVLPAADEDRVAAARRHFEQGWRAHPAFVETGYPPREIFLRAFKAERELEAWARSDDGPFRLVGSWPVLAASGAPGPKRREGDRQVPEGCYRVVIFNPKSSYHLSLGLDYPNASDRVRSHATEPGSDIYIHGGAASIGCLAIGDDAIEELYVLATDTREKPIEVHIFPCGMSGPSWEKLRAEQTAHAAFWAELQPIYDAFERTQFVPRVRVEADGAYRVE